MPAPPRRGRPAGVGLPSRFGVALSVAVSLSMGCVESSSKSRGHEAAKGLGAYVLDAPPADIPHKLDYVFDGRIRLLGYRLDPAGPSAPGTNVKLTMYWQTMDRIDDGWMLFTHLLDEKGARYASGNLDNVGPLRDTSSGAQAMPPGEWQKGKVYVDEQAFPIPAEAKGDVVVAVGIWKGESRKPITNGPGDAEHRAVVVRLKTSGDPAPPAKAVPGRDVPALTANKLEGPAPKIDGKLDDDAWRGAATTGPLVDVTNGRPNTTFPVNGSARVAWDDRALYLAFEITDTTLIGGFTPDVRGKDPHLWEKECAEIMIDPDGDGDNLDYYEIQIGTQNHVFDSQFDTYNGPRGGPSGPFGHEAWSIGGQTAVVVHGTLDKDDDTDQGYTVEAAIPWTTFSKAKKAPPAPGDTWRMNFYAMKKNGGVAWSPILGEGNFHKASRFGRVTFGAPTAKPAPSASAPRAPGKAP